MGEVYRARDTRLGREVALKVLPPGFSADPERLQRFTQEARAASALNHPNILTVFDVGEHEGAPYLVAELLDGDSLRALIERRRVTPAQAAEWVAQAARGLAAAHERGILHRDIKPENLFLTTDGRIKVLDFGLAKLLPQAAEGDAVPAIEVNGPETRAGAVLGTVAYMSPEQAEGKPCDRRSDIFSLGVVLYELLAGRRPFTGASAIDTLHAIVHDEPASLGGFGPVVGAEVGAVLEKALAKDPAERYRHAGDLELDLRRLARALSARRPEASASGVAGPPQAVRRLWPGVALGVAVLVFGAAFIGWKVAPSRVPGTAPRSLGAGSLRPLTSDPGYQGEATFAPDGETLAYVSDRTGNFEIFLQHAGGGPAINLTNNPADDVQPAFSPNGESIAFVSTRQSATDLIYRAPGLPSLMGGDVWVMPALGGMPRRVAEGGNFPSWSPDGQSLLFVRGAWFRSEICAVPAAGGQPRPLPIRLPAGDPTVPFLLYPTLSPDGRWLAFQARTSVFTVSAGGGDARFFTTGERPAWWPDGAALVFTNLAAGKGRSLCRQPFDPTTGQASGPIEPLTFGTTPAAHAGVSRDGAEIVFTALDTTFNVEEVPFDADGAGQLGPPVPWTRGNNRVSFFGASHDGSAIVYQLEQGAENHLWRLDRRGAPVQLTRDPAYSEGSPRWSPDGSTIAFTRGETGGPTAGVGVWLMAADGANPHELLARAVRPNWMPDGHGLVGYTDGGYTLVAVPGGEVTEIAKGAGAMPIFCVSPDGRWIVYQTPERGNVDLAAVAVAGGASRMVVATTKEDYHPFISPSGRWLYFQEDHKNVWRVPGPSQEWRQAAPEQITRFPESGLYLEEPNISGDGRHLFYARGRIVGNLWLLDLHGTPPTRDDSLTRTAR